MNGHDDSSTAGPTGAPDGRAVRGEFRTVFHSGTGGNRVLLLPDRIVTMERTGRSGALLLRDVFYAGPCESSWSPRAYGVYLVLRTPPYDTGYYFADPAERAAFLDELRRSLATLPGAMLPGELIAPADQ